MTGRGRDQVGSLGKELRNLKKVSLCPLCTTWLGIAVATVAPMPGVAWAAVQRAGVAWAEQAAVTSR